ncbi:MAG: hypothetical protein ACD_22C00223G0003 [uncultured bacterium]|nr:MAG: hypothetical protein ACD_22C00223G0003 [uncultured bacterium]
MHTLQKLLIKRLLDENGRTYSSLTSGYDSEDNIAFHLKQLLSANLLEKREDKYFITPQGIHTINTFHKLDLKDDIFKMFFVGLICSCGDEYLIKPHKNAKEVFYNLPSESPLFGENLVEALPRIFCDETDIHVPYKDFVFDSFHVKTVQTKDKMVLFDDAFGIYKVEVSQEQKEKMVLKKGSVWMGLLQIAKLPNRWPEIDYCVLRKDWGHYKEYVVTCDYVLK